MRIYVKNIRAKFHPHQFWNDRVLAFSWNDATADILSDLASEILLRQLMHIHLRKNNAKFHHNMLWNDGTLGFFWRGRSDKKNNNNMNSDIQI